MVNLGTDGTKDFVELWETRIEKSELIFQSDKRNHILN